MQDGKFEKYKLSTNQTAALQQIYDQKTAKISIERAIYNNTRVSGGFINALLAECESVESIEFHDVQFKGSNELKGFFSNKSVQRLTINRCNNALSDIIDIVKNNTNLSYIAINRIELNDIFAEKLADALIYNNSISTLVLDQPFNITQKGLMALKYAIENNPNILECDGVSSEISYLLLERRKEVENLIAKWRDHHDKGAELDYDTIKNLDKYKVAIKNRLKAANGMEDLSKFEADLTSLLDNQLVNRDTGIDPNLPTEIIKIIDSNRREQESSMQREICHLVLTAQSAIDFDVVIKADLSNPSFVLSKIVSDLVKLNKLELSTQIASTHYHKLTDTQKANVYRSIFWTVDKSESQKEFVGRVEQELGIKAKENAMEFAIKEVGRMMMEKLERDVFGIENSDKTLEIIVSAVKDAVEKNANFINALEHKVDKEKCLNFFEKFVIVPIKALLDGKGYAAASIDYITDNLKNDFKENVLSLAKKGKQNFVEKIKAERANKEANTEIGRS